MIRKIIQIDEGKCDGCGICAHACHEGAIEIIDGVAKLTREDYCDGFGDCLPACPMGAISFVEREAAAYDEAAVANSRTHMDGEQSAQHHASKGAHGNDGAAAPFGHGHAHGFGHGSGHGHAHGHGHGHGGGCPGAAIRSFDRGSAAVADASVADAAPAHAAASQSQLRNWPLKIELAPLRAPYFEDAHLLIAADCSAYAYGSFHTDLLRNKVALIGCPKFNSIDYAAKLTHIIAGNDIKSVTVVRMEVPCCGGLEQAAIQALKDSGKFIPWQVVTLSLDGRILD